MDTINLPKAFLASPLHMKDSNYVSIVVCHYSKADDFGEIKARNCRYTRSEMLHMQMESLVKNTDYPAEIIVIDNGGNPDDSEYLLGLTRRGVVNTYVRNKENMYFGWVWNQGMRLATGSHVCLTCNDLEFKPKWLSTTIKPLLDYPDRKYIATPIVTPDKNVAKFYRDSVDRYRVNTLAGSNCMIMTKETFYDIGEMTTHSVAGTIWGRRMHSLGYLMIIPPVNYADHLAHQGGYDYTQKAEIKKTLLKGEVIDYTQDGQKCVTIGGCKHQLSGNGNRFSGLFSTPHN